MMEKQYLPGLWGTMQILLVAIPVARLWSIKCDASTIVINTLEEFWGTFSIFSM